MLIHLLTIHPALCQGPLEEAIIGRAREKGLVDIRLLNLRDFALDRHRTTDDYPYGGGQGLVMKAEPIFRAVEHAVAQGPGDPRILLMDPGGRRFDQTYAAELARAEHLIFICGRYEGVDERVRTLATDEVSIGDFVLTGGELAALCIIDAVVRLVPGVLGDPRSAADDSFTTGLLEGPQYTRPPELRGLRVPEILLSGDHGAVARWRRKEALRRTLLRRPDLLHGKVPDPLDRELLQELSAEGGEVAAAIARLFPDGLPGAGSPGRHRRRPGSRR